ncbi:MAG TPA: ABC transporter permease [Marinobacter adhaerens]|jgi:branched-chain amino acid transport system substrate-binding protein|uniref:ABC transporter substrate-binding protein n=1 Tax=unclassified Marinobacter TaxID=83889 RepID=UPI00069E624E|nr:MULTISPECIES: ABC transporter substrate-binding protein [unclassified Marinobacter]AKV96806.1 ABC transporter permease [Marinobacter sp. CP1]HBX40167.1 ABC transporter permease [Marinobacter adhaerens]|tara:strand:- start:16102 stop:17277 length:1176 start_codon:yes stop_codon:yes gene_type:complete
MSKIKTLAGAVLATTLTAGLSTSALAAAGDPVKIGVMLPFSGIYAQLGEAGRDGLKLALKEHAEKLHGSKVEFIELDTEAKPSRAPELASSLLNQHEADFVIGPVHSGVAMGMIKMLRGKDTIMIIPNAGSAAATGPLCSPNVFRTSFSSWQPSYPMGKVALEKGYKKVYAISWNYGMGRESLDAFEESFTAGGGEIVEKVLLPFPSTNFQSHVSDIADENPDAVFTFFAGGGAIKFVKDYDAMGLRGKIPLMGSGFLTEGTLQAQGDAAEGVMTGLHYAEQLDVPKNREFREAFNTEYGHYPDIYAVQGYDAGQAIANTIDQLEGDISDKQAVISTMEKLTIDSPRGEFTFSKAHNPIQNIYLREVKDGVNVVQSIAAEALEDPARGCKL